MGAQIRDLKRRIRSIKNNSQLTRAMKMVSAAKLRRAQETMLGARPYSEALRRVLADVSARASAETHPLLVEREVELVELVVVTGDKGLCGSFNVNVFRRADAAIEQHRTAGHETSLVLIGKKGVDYYRRRGVESVERHADVFRSLDYTFAVEVAAGIRERFLSGESDAVYLVFNEFKSTIAQNLIVRKILPVSGLGADEGEAGPKGDYIYEPDADKLLAGLLPKFVEFELYHALLESIASEHAARMTAMDAATRNAGELIEKLTLVMNRARQAAITTEIIEVVSGAEALG